MRLALVLVLAASPALGDPRKATKPACTKKVVGKGLERKVICEFEAPVVVTASAPKPKVVIAPADGRKVVGRPKQADPLRGLDRRSRHD